MVGAEEASSPDVVGRGLSLEQSAAWALFTPTQRVLLVAIVAAATADVNKCRRTSVLRRRPLQSKDEVLMNMSRKLDYLCEEVNSWKEQELLPFSAGDIFQSGLSSCGCRFQSSPQMNRLSLDSKMSALYEEAGMEPREERRMSALSDWNSSGTSASEIQMSTLALEQDVFILQKDCDQKEATIKELLDLVKCADEASSKRINELEDVIKRKNLLINKLKKDVNVLEQKVVNLTRLRRPSHLQSVGNIVKAPVMSSNLLYDMESSPTPDSDSSSPIGGKQSKVTSNKSHHLDDDKENRLQHNPEENSAVSMQKTPNRQGKKPLGNPVKEKVLTQNCGSSTFSNSRDVSSSSGGLKISKRHSVQSLRKGCI